MSEKRKNPEEAPRTPICPLCQHTEFEPIVLDFGEGHSGRWDFPGTADLLSVLIPERKGPIKALRCAHCYHILFFAAD